MYSASVIALSAMMLGACSTTASKSGSDSSAKTSQTSKKTSSEKAKTTNVKKIAGADLKDGTYKLEEDNYYNGYKVVMSMTVKDGKITKTSYDNVNKDGKSKADDAAYEKQMKKFVKIGPKEYIPKLAKEFADNGSNSSGVQVVSGATSSTLTMRNYINQLVQAAQKGDTDTIHINNNKPMKDGTYKLEQKNYYNGYRQVFTLVVKKGKVADLKYDQINKDGMSKTKDAKYEKAMKKVNGVGPKEYIPKLAKEFMDAKGNMEKVQVVSGATHSSNDFISYVEQLMNAAQKGDTKTIIVDNIVTKE
ncbi:hypothetical protein FC52_GL000937 [Lactobacillus pasteurii DSM 23907 = CRBIP 24.76]|nr:hypothetical protein FC52_GL000937 [Lactobacillus pasteurii DSM 23907 = CRBIP 24.76]